VTTDDQDRPESDVTQRFGAADDPPTQPFEAIDDPTTQKFAVASELDPHADFRRQAAEHFKAAQPQPHAEYLRPIAQRFGDAPASSYAQSPAAPSTHQMHLDLWPWHAASAVGALCLLLALVASSSFGWIVVAVLCAGGAWYLKAKSVAWPSAIREALVRQGLTNPLTLATEAQPPEAAGSGLMHFDLRPWHAASAVGALCLLLALVASSSFGWIVVAVLCAGGAWYLKAKSVAWPSAIREALVRQGLTNPSASAADAQPIYSPPAYALTNSGDPKQAPGGGAAIAAALLALALGIYWLVQTYDLWRTVVQFSGASVPGTGGLKATVILEAVVSTATTIALLVGGARLLNRHAGGRGLIVFGCVIVLADAAATWVTIYGGYSVGLSAVPSVVSPRLFESMVHSQDELKTWVLIATALTLLTLVLAWSKASGQWCGEGTPTIRRSPVVAGIAVAALVALVAAVGAHSAQTAYEPAATPTTTTTTVSSAADSTSLAIKNATVNSCIHRATGTRQADGTMSLVSLWATSCSSSDATDVVTEVTDSTSPCGSEWVQTKAFGQLIVLCLRKM
jgi:hypothetical protein